MRETLKSAIIVFHKNLSRYPERWISRFRLSIKSQTLKPDIFEIDYGGGGNRLFAGDYENKELENHAEAHNYLLDKVFNSGYDVAFNTNVDDFYAPNRCEIQSRFIKHYDIVTSNFYLVNEDDRVIGHKKMHGLRFDVEARKNHNILAHPAMCYSKKFWSNCSRLNPLEIPKDDFELWKREWGKFDFAIAPHFLLYYRIHELKTKA